MSRGFCSLCGVVSVTENGREKIGGEGRAVFHGVAGLPKKRFDVPFEEVACHVGANDFNIRFEGVGIAGAKFGGDFESDVDQLAEMRIVVRAMPVVP